MTRRLALLLLVACSVAVAVAELPGPSSATFTASSGSAARVAAAADWTPPTAALQTPESPVKDTAILAASASDAETGIRNVAFQYLLAGGSWVTVCTTTSAPYTCSWNTKTVADGAYDLRVVATDNAGYSATSEPVRTTVANNLLVVLATPGDVVRGATALSTTLHNTGSTSYTVRVEYAPAGTTSWKPICNGLTAPYVCSWNSGGFANEYYDLRAVAVAGGTTTASATVSEVLVDNQAPGVTMLDPGTPLSGTRTFTANASDAHSGIAQVVIQYAPSGSASYQPLCAVTADPFTCRFDTTRLVDGTYSFRAMTTDVAGNSTTSAAVTNRVVDNTVSSVSLEDPGAFMSGTVPVTANANSTAGVASVRIQYAGSGANTWADLCVVTNPPYTCSWDTTRSADGPYDVRAVLLDGAGRTTTSAVVAARRIDNTPLRGADIQSVNGGGSVGRAENGDSITFTYTDQLDLDTMLPGWTGGPLAVRLRLRDGSLVGLSAKNDTLDVLRSSGPTSLGSVNLGSVNLKEDYVKGGKTAIFNATMTAGTTTVDGTEATAVTVTLGTLASGGGLRTAGNASGMVWTPSGAAEDRFGTACSTAPTAESGVLDREL